MYAGVSCRLAMEPIILVSRIKALLANAPLFDNYLPSSHEHQAWLAQAHALIAKWKPLEAISVKTASDFLSNALTRDHNLAQIYGALHRAIADLELSLPSQAGQAFGPGAVYDFFKALNGLIASATSSLLIAAPFMDPEIFDAYLLSAPAGIRIRLLTKKGTAGLKPAIGRFSAQRGNPVEARASKAFHDRVVFIDGSDCWIVGQSIRDAAKSMPSYLAPLSQDVALDKLGFYEAIWNEAEPI
jgi:hypothetical protein